MKVLFFIGLFFAGTPAFGFIDTIWDYIKRYQIGIEKSASLDHVQVTYETSAGNTGCPAVSDQVDDVECQVSLDAGGKDAFSLYLEQAFKKQGFFYFDYDLGFAIQTINDRLPASQLADNRPLKSMRLDLYGLITRAYIQFGITPDYFPDILFSVGPAFEFITGKVAINNSSRVVGLISHSGLQGFALLEIVLLRFGKGAFSIFSSSDLVNSEVGNAFYPETVDGMHDFKANFAKNVFGLKLLLDFP